MSLVFLIYVENLSAEILSGIRKETEEGRLPSNVAAGMEELYQNYKNAVIFFVKLIFYFTYLGM